MNQNPERRPSDRIDGEFVASDWMVQDKSRMNLARTPGVAVREYLTDVGPSDYVLFVD